MSRIRERLTYANAMSTIAVFAVLGGGAYAASSLDKNEVKSKHIKAGAVKRADLAANAVTAPKVANGSLRAEDFAAGQLPPGPPGPTGPEGPMGPAGSNAAADGPTLMTGSVQGPNPDCLTGAPTGFSVSGSCDAAGIDARVGIIPTDKVARNIRFEVNQSPVGTQFPFALSRDTGPNFSTTVGACTIEPGQTSCSVPGPGAVPAGSRLFVQLDRNAPGFSFGYELWNLNAAPRAAAPADSPTPSSVSSD